MRNWMTFYSFAITFRHEHIRKDQEDGCYHALNCERIFFFANQIFRDKKFPNDSNIYEELKQYATENYSEDILIGFELIWKKYEKAKLHALNEAHNEALAHNEKYSSE